MTVIPFDQRLMPAPASRNFIVFPIAQCVSFSGDWMAEVLAAGTFLFGVSGTLPAVRHLYLPERLPAAAHEANQ
ncbi:hypothetical protein LJR098_001976 [Rhizobium sp. LjRoot98]|uniref:hypothetical protein n=1 Tax=Rhizobium sp. LjRoot98 TaxID=3342345 RepID=UPI003ECC8C85